MVYAATVTSQSPISVSASTVERSQPAYAIRSHSNSVYSRLVATKTTTTISTTSSSPLGAYP
jgi:hypothetical protein